MLHDHPTSNTPTFDAADFSEDAVLASYAPQEDDIDVCTDGVEFEFPKIHTIHGGPHLGSWGGVISRKKKKEEKLDAAELPDNHLDAEINRFYPTRKIKIVTSISRAEKGLFHGEKAHFIVLKVERKGELPDILESLKLHVRVDPFEAPAIASAPAVLGKDSVNALAKLSIHSGTNTGTQSDPLPITSSLPTVPDPPKPLYIIRYAPKKVVGIRSTIKHTEELGLEGDAGVNVYGADLGVKATRKWGKEFETEEHFSVLVNVDNLATYDTDTMATASHDDDSSALNALHLYASANPLHREGIPDIIVGIIVLSNGQPFTLTVNGEATPRKKPGILFTPFDRTRPAKFSYESKNHLPYNQEAIPEDFGSKEMEKHWKELVTWPLEYRNVSRLELYSRVTNVVLIPRSFSEARERTTETTRSRHHLTTECQTQLVTAWPASPCPSYVNVRDSSPAASPTHA